MIFVCAFCVIQSLIYCKSTLYDLRDEIWSNFKRLNWKKLSRFHAKVGKIDFVTGYCGLRPDRLSFLSPFWPDAIDFQRLGKVWRFSNWMPRSPCQQMIDLLYLYKCLKVFFLKKMAKQFKENLFCWIWNIVRENNWKRMCWKSSKLILSWMVGKKLGSEWERDKKHRSVFCIWKINQEQKIKKWPEKLRRYAPTKENLVKLWVSIN